MSYEIPTEAVRVINGLINQPWVRDGRNCWRVTREVVAALGYKLPPVLEVAPGGKEGRSIKSDLFNTHPERGNWQEVTSTDTWALVLMHRPFRPAVVLEHSGIYFATNGGRILHSCDPHGVVFDTMSELKLRNWVPIFLVPKGE